MSDQAAAPLRHHNLPLTAIRGFAALWVVGHHLQFELAYIGYPFAGWLFRPGYVAVDIFFVLSGFVITAVHRDLTCAGLGDFFIRRIFRVYPLHLFVLALILGLWLWSEARFGSHDPTERLHALPIVVLLLQPYLIHGLTWNTVSWSIGVELLCYALFPLVIGGLRRLEFVGCVLVLLMMAAIERHVHSELVWGWPAIARGLAGFGLGMAVQQMTVLAPRPRAPTASLFEVGALLGILIAILGGYLSGSFRCSVRCSSGRSPPSAASSPAGSARAGAYGWGGFPSPSTSSIRRSSTSLSSGCPRDGSASGTRSTEWSGRSSCWRCCWASRR